MNRFRQGTLRLELEALETRQLLAAGCLEVATSFTFSSEYFAHLVTSGYEYYLRRSPDDSGLRHWASQLEQGATDEEFEAASAAGFREASLGKNILRTETAVVAGLAATHLYFDGVERAPKEGGHRDQEREGQAELHGAHPSK